MHRNGKVFRYAVGLPIIPYLNLHCILVTRSFAVLRTMSIILDYFLLYRGLFVGNCLLSS